MSDAKHTPGPWTIDQRLDANGTIWGPYGMQTCTVEDCGGEMRANANLIAAAPDLLEALRELRDACETAYKAGRISALPFIEAGNVIAKAEGRS